MKKALFLTLLLMMEVTMAVATTPRLILNLDINKTLIAEDMATGKTMEYILSNALAEKVVHVWDRSFPAMTYREYVDTFVAPGDKQTQREIVKNFIPYLETSDYAGRFEVIETYKKASEKMEGKYLIPSFVKMVRTLQEQEVDFRIILRTFGNDIRVGKITEEIDTILDGSRVEHWGEFKDERLEMRHGPTLEKVEDIYRFFVEGSGHMAIKDDWHAWNRDGERGRSGKPFIFDPDNKDVVSVFVDDNINPDPESEKNIVHALRPDGSVVPLREYMNRNVFIADVIEAILDEDYFLRTLSLK